MAIQHYSNQICNEYDQIDNAIKSMIVASNLHLSCKLANKFLTDLSDSTSQIILTSGLVAGTYHVEYEFQNN